MRFIGVPTHKFKRPIYAETVEKQLYDFRDFDMSIDFNNSYDLIGDEQVDNVASRMLGSHLYAYQIMDANMDRIVSWKADFKYINKLRSIIR